MAQVTESDLKSLQQDFINSILELDEPTLDTQSHSSGNQGIAQNHKYKTEKCRYWAMAKSCPFGKNCSFAHYNWQMREKHTHCNYKTKHCNNFTKFGCCKYGDRCQFKHEVRKVECVTRKGSNFWDQLDFLPNKIQNDFYSQQQMLNQKRLKIFKEFSEDGFDKINWVYKKPRMYTI